MPGYPCGCQPAPTAECGCTGIKPASVQVLLRNIKDSACQCSTMLNGLYTLLPSQVSFGSTCSTCLASTNLYCGYSWEGSITLPNTSGVVVIPDPCGTKVWRMEAVIEHDFSVPWLGWRVALFDSTHVSSTDRTFYLQFDCSNYASGSTNFNCFTSYSSSPVDFVGGGGGCNVIGAPLPNIDLTPST